MIQVYKETNTDYSKNGDCVLMPSECLVKAELNGAWSCSLVHPIDPEGRWNYLTAQAVVKLPSFNGDQLFRIKSREKNLNEVSCKLEPIFFDSGGDCWLYNVKVSNKTGQEALNLMTAPNSKYTGESNITSRATATYHWKTLTQALSASEDENNFLSKWGGEVLYDNFKVIINEEVGEDRGLEIRYGKNLQGINETIDMTDLITRIWPETYCGHPTKYGYITSPLESNYPIPHQCVMMFDNIRYIEDITDEAKEVEEGRIIVHDQNEIDMQLYQACAQQFAAGIDKPVITLEVDMVLVGYTEQYSELKGLEDVQLGDTVHVFSENIGIETSMRVFSLEYDAIKERAVKIKLGSEAYNYFANTSKDIKIQQSALNDTQILLSETLGKADETELNLAEITDYSDSVLTVKGDKLKGENWYGTDSGIVFSEPPTRAGTFRMITEDGKVKFQYLPSGETEWEDIGYLQRYVESGDNVLGLVSAPDGNARIWVEDEDKYVWLSGEKINIYANNGKMTLLGNDVEIDNMTSNQQFHPFTVENKPVSTTNDYNYFTPPGNCHYLVSAAMYHNTSSLWVKGFQNSGTPAEPGGPNQWIVLYSSVPSGGYVTLIWI